jgi:hypothetical protein
MDLVLILDTSSSMSGSYREVLDYITGPFLREFLRIGDTFHLLSFADTPRTEISRRVEGVGDVETIIGRMLLMYPLEPYTDLPGALEYGENYVSSLPPGRPKKVVLITDGEHNPPPASSRTGMDQAAIQGLISGAEARFVRRGIDFYVIPVPLRGNGPASGRTAARPSPPPAQSPAASPPPLSPPAAGGQPPGVTTSAAGGQTPGGTAPAAAAATAAAADPAPSPGSPPPEAPPESPASLSPSGEAPAAAAPGEISGTAPTGGTGDGQASGIGGGSAVQDGPGAAEGEPGGAPSGGAGGGGFSLNLPLLIGLILAVLLILGAVIFTTVRRLQGSPNRAMASAASPGRISQDEGEKYRDQSASRNAEFLNSFAAARQSAALSKAHRKPLQDVVFPPMEGPPMLSLFVENQSLAIGKRNIHAAKSGTTYSVGGGASDFLIFLVSMPSHIADIHFSGDQCTFIPRKPQYFPDLGSQTMPNCIGKAIRVISDKEYEFFIRVDRYQDPLIALNRLLNSIQVPDK